MSLAGGCEPSLSDRIESTVLGSSSDKPVAMPTIVDRHCSQQSLEKSSQKWTNGGSKPPSCGKKDGSGSNNRYDDNSDELPKPKIILCDMKIDTFIRPARNVGCGLVNLNNTCFLNSTLQCLSHIPPWFNYIISDHHLNNCKMSRSECMVCMFQRHIKNSLRTHGAPISPREIVDRLKQICDHMQKGRQEDAHEFLLGFLNGMQTSLLYGLEKLDSYSQETTVLCQVFGGYLRSQVRCKLCLRTSCTFEHFFNIGLDIKNTKSLVGALTSYTKVEMLDGENSYNCDRCKQQAPAEKRYTVHKAPLVLIIQLKRYCQEENRHTKLTHHIFFNERLDLTPFMSKPGPQFSQLYKLQCVLVHNGFSIASGHFFSYVCGQNDRWYEVNDERVHEVEFEKVKASQAYMLFFMKISNRSPAKVDRPQNSSQLIMKNGGTFMGNGNKCGAGQSVCISLPTSSLTNNKRKFAEINAGEKEVNISNLQCQDSDDAQNNRSAAQSYNTTKFRTENTSFSLSPSSSGNFKKLIISTKENENHLGNHREKIAFKIIRAKDSLGCSNTTKPSISSIPGSIPSKPVACPSSALQSSSATVAVKCETVKVKLVAYDDESSDQECDRSSNTISKDAVHQMQLDCQKSAVQSLSADEAVGLVMTTGPSAIVDFIAEASAMDVEAKMPCSSGKVTLNLISSLVTPISKSVDLESVIGHSSKLVPEEQLPKMKRSSSESNLRNTLPLDNKGTVFKHNSNLCKGNDDGKYCYDSIKLDCEPSYDKGSMSVMRDMTESKHNKSVSIKDCEMVHCNPVNSLKPIPSYNDIDRAMVRLSPDKPPNGFMSLTSLAKSTLGSEDAHCFAPALPPTQIERAKSPGVLVKEETSLFSSNGRHISKSKKLSKHKHRKHRHRSYNSEKTTSEDSFDYIWVERTIETIEQENNDVTSKQYNTQDESSQNSEVNLTTLDRKCSSHYRSRSRSCLRSQSRDRSGRSKSCKQSSQDKSTRDSIPRRSLHDQSGQPSNRGTRRSRSRRRSRQRSLSSDRNRGQHSQSDLSGIRKTSGEAVGHNRYREHC